MLRSALNSVIVRNGLTASVVKRTMAGSVSSVTSAVSKRNQKERREKISIDNWVGCVIVRNV
jgi:hypothetical protein